MLHILKDNCEAVEEIQKLLSVRLLRALLSYELVKNGWTAFTWRDNFCRETVGILAQHAIQSKMSRY